VTCGAVEQALANVKRLQCLSAVRSPVT